MRGELLGVAETPEDNAELEAAVKDYDGACAEVKAAAETSNSQNAAEDEEGGDGFADVAAEAPEGGGPPKFRMHGKVFLLTYNHPASTEEWWAEFSKYAKQSIISWKVYRSTYREAQILRENATVSSALVFNVSNTRCV